MNRKPGALKIVSHGTVKSGRDTVKYGRVDGAEIATFKALGRFVGMHVLIMPFDERSLRFTGTQLETNAILWWRSKRPFDATEEWHLENPTHGCTTREEKMLAIAIADQFIHEDDDD